MAAAATAAATCLCMTAVSNPAQFRGNHVDEGVPDAASGSDSGGGSSIDGGRNDGVQSLGVPFDSQRNSEEVSRPLVGRRAGRQSGR